MVSKQSAKPLSAKLDTSPDQPLNGAVWTQRVQQYEALKRDLVDFVLDAEGELATALEAFSAEQIGRWGKPSLSGLDRGELAIDMFATEGQVAGQSVIDLWIKSEASLSAEVQTWLGQWQTSFNGLFVVQDVRSDSYVLMNWLTEKRYSVRAGRSQPTEILSRMKVGEIVLARLLPLTSTEWTFSGPLTLLGKLGEPKLAVAIGNFKKWFPQHLYGDAPEMKEVAWESVQQQHEDFVEFFGAEQVTLSGYELNKKLQAYQDHSTEKQLSKAGIDSSKSLQEIAKDAGISEEDVSEAMDALGEESTVAQKLLESKQSLRMVMPKVNLPDELRRAEAVTAFVHPRWGQIFLKDYAHLEELLTQSSSPEAEAETLAKLDRLTLKYLAEDRVNAYVWRRLAEAYKNPIEGSLRRVLDDPKFDAEQDLEKTLIRYGKALIPELPDSASVPIHLHELFQSALKAVGKETGKKDDPVKKKAKKKSGFGS
ncbi:MAG: hypothetical protein WBB01_26230 [Phormidesmis sp.]